MEKNKQSERKRKLQGLAKKIDAIIHEELKKENAKCSFAEAKGYNIRRVGVQGDQRTYGHPAEIKLKEIKHKDNKLYNEKEFYNFLEKLSNTITNEIKDINGVVYLLKEKTENN